MDYSGARAQGRLEMALRNDETAACTWPPPARHGQGVELAGNAHGVVHGLDGSQARGQLELRGHVSYAATQCSSTSVANVISRVSGVWTTRNSPNGPARGQHEETVIRQGLVQYEMLHGCL